MNPYTGGLMRIVAGGLAVAEAQGFKELPQELQAEAQTLLSGRDHARVDLRKRGPLQDWAKKKRREKIAAKSRRINRSK